MVSSLKRKGELELYDEMIKEQLRLGFTEIIENPEAYADRGHYLPHFPVFKSDSTTTRMRLGHDASAKSKGSESLNDKLETGPSLIPDLPAILLGFRLENVAVVADLEKAFPQIELAVRDRDATRFIWLKDLMKEIEEDNLLHIRFKRLFFGAKSIPFIFNATVTYHFDRQTAAHWVACHMKKSMYVDNLATSLRDVTSAMEYQLEARSIFEAASMNLREWMSNSTELRMAITPEKLSEKCIIKVLGVVWNAETDELNVMVPKTENLKPLQQKVTTRMLCSVLAQIFDRLY